MKHALTGKRKKSVLILVQNLPVPQDRRIWMEARALKKCGFTVSVISPREAGQKKFESVAGISLYRYVKPPKSSGYASYLWEYLYSFSCTFYLAWKVFVTRGFSVIHSANPPDFFFLIALPFKLLGVRYVYDQHDLVPEMFTSRFGRDEKHLLYRALVVLEKLNYYFSDIHLATCVSGQEKMFSRNRAKAPSFIVRSAPDVKQINKNSVNNQLAAELREKFAFLCSYVGVMGPQDGVDKLLRSIRCIVHDWGRRDVGFILMGDGDDYERLRRMAEDLRIADNVIFTGWADAKKLFTCLFVSAVGLMPEPKNEYTDNSLHNKVLEYMAAGLPVVSYDLKEARRSAGEAAVFVEGGDEQKFGAEILQLLENEPLRKEMGAIGKSRIKKMFRISYAEQELRRAYATLFPDLSGAYDHAIQEKKEKVFLRSA